MRIICRLDKQNHKVVLNEITIQNSLWHHQYYHWLCSTKNNYNLKVIILNNKIVHMMLREFNFVNTKYLFVRGLSIHKYFLQGQHENTSQVFGSPYETKGERSRLLLFISQTQPFISIATIVTNIDHQKQDIDLSHLPHLFSSYCLEFIIVTNWVRKQLCFMCNQNRYTIHLPEMP